MKKNKGITTFMGKPVTLLGDMVQPGEIAPNFTALAADSKPVNLSDFKGKVIIISSVPSVDTGVCAAQTRRFNTEAASLGEVVILTISCDLPFALGRFCAAEGIDKVITLSDHKDTDFGLKYGFLIEELRLLNRGIVVIDREGIIRYIEYVKENTHHPDYDAAIAAARKLI
ncbi:MAG TPA: thiol peroxidase [Bacteroidales bacterium]|jgi:thiol peroxidase|nr:thiol peroxidase [Bacteroidales bacterium]MDI9574372.1 thiol peroxidase [Bacteroidota bacterium]OQC61691.1 MAG: putative thiol peroxidase [Bacteroidetes bacterium ADurb.Bin012]MBP9511330.1 thiol peroxidase [Bacteroidales bacterium]MBP9587852.1 thiol peroxidase [Bacteroidales bacterium]